MGVEKSKQLFPFKRDTLLIAEHNKKKSIPQDPRHIVYLSQDELFRETGTLFCKTLNRLPKHKSILVSAFKRLHVFIHVHGLEIPNPTMNTGCCKQGAKGTGNQKV